MNLRRAIGLVVLPFLFGGLNGRAAAPATKPTPATILNGRIEFTPPSEWHRQANSPPGDMAAIYVAGDENGTLAIHVLPENATINEAAARKIVAQLRAIHKKNGQAIDLAPMIEKDARFVIKIHERYKVKEDKITDETHLYRQVGGRAVELDVQTYSESADHIADVRKIGEDMLISAQWKNGPKVR